ncbi:ATP-binding protein [Paenibacillus sp. RRE4]|uniref:HD domain-containing protein n=1 Tax=Paenibacillus sp. RRE4 TaxID=2962587 RepID=UPI002880DC99|nr:ATP-binding protein [Paenibacillus sp. RRE4]MDT0124890.1 ATP-binding protein [Paenibacillus sp. RRE4]
MIDLNTDAEILAKQAESLQAFSGLNLLHIKREVSQMLNQIGKGGIFDQYTLHDITHIDEMLKILEWLIPQETKKLMTPADWLITVLSIYFHDLGMVVTKREFENRNLSSFNQFKIELLTGKSGEDYKDKIERMSSDDSEKFLYQEFVRQKHAERIKWWITGSAPSYLGIATEIIENLNVLLQNLDPLFRRDLAIICESHHLDDLYDINKYKLSQPYGNSQSETANMQYAAILLRSADLLHITKDRTPSTAFYIINPSDPISQTEWAKQMAVRNVRPKIGVNKEFIPDLDAPKDTIEVFAHFRKEDGFFGLTSYLTYAENEIKKNANWVEKSSKLNSPGFKYPWRYIDQSNIETEGFLQKTFNFTFDQAKILDLLTGHTLYNDTNVVLRELVQNALDAVRVQCRLNGQDPYDYGAVHIKWDNNDRILTVQDNGTGMTQEIIENHLLKAGSSRYQDSNFKKQFPDFSPISRFGIGILSAFMIADFVEIITVHPDEEKARHLTLRSVHGKYLIRLLDKQTDTEVNNLLPHGTIIKIKVRPSAKISSMTENAKRWIVIPNCRVTITEDNGEKENIGYKDLKEALTNYLSYQGYNLNENSNIQVRQQEINGVSVAYALKWSEYFREWTFLELPSSRKTHNINPAGVCIEGIRVEFASPGFLNTTIAALANASGMTAPKTNVARSNIETTPEKESFIREIYRMYCRHISSEIEELHENRKFSLTWATQEAFILLSPFNDRQELVSHDWFVDAANDIRILLVENGGSRKNISPNVFMKEHSSFWTIDGRFFSSAELLLKEVQANASLTSIVSSLNMSTQLPDEPIFCITSSTGFYSTIFNNKEVTKIALYKDQRRVDLLWSDRQETPKWLALSEKVITKLRAESQHHESYNLVRKAQNLFCAVDNVDIINSDEEVCIRASGRYFLLPNNEITHYISELFTVANNSESPEDMLSALFATLFLTDISFESNISSDLISNTINRLSRIFLEFYRVKIEDIISTKDLVSLVTGLKTFDPSAWDRRESITYSSFDFDSFYNFF